ncbi:hypothetical protein FKM82_017857 [Ascaphus truei]
MHLAAVTSPARFLQKSTSMELTEVLHWRRAILAVSFNLMALTLSTTALLSSYWCEGTQKVPKPLCGNGKATKCIVVPVAVENVNASVQDVLQYSWETGDDRFAFRYFHTGIWYSCEENILGADEKCRSFLELTPPAERGILWLSLGSEMVYIALLMISFGLLLAEMFYTGNPVCGLKLNAFAAMSSVLSGKQTHLPVARHYTPYNIHLRYNGIHVLCASR